MKNAMKDERCAFEEKIAAANRSGRWSDELLAHVVGCRACEEVALVASYLSKSAAASQPAPAVNLPDAALIWSRAQLAARREAIERAMRPILWVRRFALGAGATAILVAIILAWSRVSDFLAGFVDSWRNHAAPPSAGPNSVLLAIMAAFLLILVPLIFSLYTSWSED